MEQRRPRLAFALGIGIALCLGVVPAASAQSGKEVARSLCGALTPAEVRQAMDVRMDARPDLYACYWGTTDLADPERNLAVLWHQLGFEELQAVAPDLTALTVAGRPALYDPNSGQLSISLDQGVLVLSASDLQGTDWQAALEQLGEHAVGRAADLVAPPPVDPDLAALFPTSVGDEAFEITPAYADQVFPGRFDPGKALRTALKRQDKGLADVALAVGIARPSLASINALRVAGADAAAFGEPATSWLMGVGWTADPDGYANGSITVVTGASGGRPVHVYPRDDVVWVINAEEPQLGAILAALPGAPALPGSSATPPASALPNASAGPSGAAGAGTQASESPRGEGTSADVSVEDLLPGTVGGQDLQVIQSGDLGGGFMDTRTSRALDKALQATGTKVRDVTALIAATAADPQSVVTAFEIDGTDASAFVDFAIEAIMAGMPSRKHTRETGEVAGKAVTIVRPEYSSSPLLHVYARDDIVWVLIAKEPALSELLTALP